MHVCLRRIVELCRHPGSSPRMLVLVMLRPAIRRVLLPVAVLVVGVAARCAVGTLGFNYDVISYRRVAKLVHDGQNIYATTSRYNYSPCWSYVVHRLAMSASSFPDPFTAFRWHLTLLLTGIDIGIAALLFERFGTRAASLFFLNPVVIFITGYHRQFDNVAILIGLLAVALAERARSSLGTSLAATVLGFSLAVKHVFFAFPLWLAVKQRT